MCVRENTSRAASVEFVRHRRTNYARSRPQAFCRKNPEGFSTVSDRPRRRSLFAGIPQSRLCRASPPLGKGAKGTGVADCHTSDIGHWFAMTGFPWSVVHGRRATARVAPTEGYKECLAGGRTGASAPTECLPIGFCRGRCPHRPASVTRGAVKRAVGDAGPYG